MAEPAPMPTDPAMIHGLAILREFERHIRREYNETGRWLWEHERYVYLERLFVLAAAHPAGDQTVTISLNTANWASVAFAHAPWSDDPEVREHVRRASQELGAAIDVALEALATTPAPGGPGSEADHD